MFHVFNVGFRGKWCDPTNFTRSLGKLKLGTSIVGFLKFLKGGSIYYTQFEAVWVKFGREFLRVLPLEGLVWGLVWGLVLTFFLAYLSYTCVVGCCLGGLDPGPLP